MTRARRYSINSVRLRIIRGISRIIGVCEGLGDRAVLRGWWAAYAVWGVAWIWRIPGFGSIELIVNAHEARPDVIVGCWSCAIVPSVRWTLKYIIDFWRTLQPPR